MTVMIAIHAHISFRAVPRVLSFFHSGDDWIPHFTSVINWTLRFGLALLSQVTMTPEPWVAIMDHSIDIGVKKVLVVLRLPLNALSKRGSAVTLQDCECIGIHVSERSTGEDVAVALTDIFAVSGAPSAIIKDGGFDLKKGVDLWRKNQDKMQVKVIDDIGHVVANAIKSQYSDSRLFNVFLGLVNRCSRQLQQTQLAFLKPPKLRTKGRFQGISKFAEWAVKILELFDDARNDMGLKKLRLSLLGLSQVKAFIGTFAKTVLQTSEIMKILKNEGLNQQTYRKCKQMTEDLPERSIARKAILAWLEKHLHIQCRLGIGQMPLIVSSDIIESLFGKFKQILDRSSMMDMNRSVLIIPTLCKTHTEKAVIESLKQILHGDILKWDDANIPYTQNRKRRSFLNGNSDFLVPNTGEIISQIT